MATKKKDMIINNRTCITFDIESLVNCFTCATLNTETNEIIVFEVSGRKNQIKELTNFFLQNNNKYYYVGYNNIHFDNPVINYCIEYFRDSEHTWDKITKSIKNLSNIIIENQDESKWKNWKYKDYFLSIDLLTMLYSKALRISLKAMQVTMHFKNVQEMHIDWEKPISIDKIDDLINYNINDVEATATLLNNCKSELDLRIAIEKDYGVSCLSRDGMKIGVDILEHKICEKTGISKKDLKEMRSPCQEVDLNKVILPWIKFESKEFSEILEDMKKQIISDGRGVLNYEKVYNGLLYSIGVGGLHSLNKPETIKPKENELLIDLDAASLYPSLIIEHGFGPRHLGKEFIETYIQIRDERLQAKKNKEKLKDITLKLALNGVTGNLGNEFSWMYDPFAVLQIRINGQLMFLMLVEMLTKIGCKVVSANTDGLTTIIPKHLEKEYYNICEKWEKLTKLTLEFVEYEKLIFKAVNDYIAVKKGIYQTEKENYSNYIKTKGLFNVEVVPGKGLSPKIIPAALINYFVYDISIEKTIKECTDIKMFLMSEKTGKQWTVEYNNESIQQVNRFYVSNKGLYLFKKKNTDKGLSYTQMCRKPIRILNKFTNTHFDEYNVDHVYYISECNKIIEEIQPKQLSLFN